ncbi:mycoredoxin [Arcanobacterium wilhelmae]|uniref:Mycoredoxin n=1 Tax=Arcanobacterium wilhelmae TaxID=1803177 RepID=A0ABT9NAF9_9ACTO|nr:mycoredoxin [Arcanobacterium wilhelmae]MDP9800475.1 mycoredoxin [Arcanobacterium wilhelmae]WFN89894.1 mycoredoxin [Arcanobacterium wilhelmae]
MEKVTMYTTSWCGYCKNLKKQLGAKGIEYTEVDIEEHPEAAETVAAVNDGNHVVPTVQFWDGTTMTNPSAAEVEEKLSEA